MIERISITNSMKFALILWKKYFVKIAIIGLIVYIPTQICIELVSIIITKNNILIKNQNNVYNFIRDFIGSIALLGIINFATRILENKDEQKIGEIILHGLKKWPTFLGLSIIAGFKILGYTILLIIPGIYKFVKLSFIDCAVATYDNHNDELDALEESEQLVQNQWWRIFSFLLLMFIFRLLLESIFLILFIFISKSIINSFIIGVIIQVLGTYFIMVRAVFYFKIKEVKNKEIISNEIRDEIKNY